MGHTENKSTIISVLTLNVSGLINPIKRHRLPDWLVRTNSKLSTGDNI